jgi:hypothetical protein
MFAFYSLVREDISAWELVDEIAEFFISSLSYETLAVSRSIPFSAAN